MQQRLLAIQQSDMTHAARSLYAVYLAHADERGVARSEDGTPLTQKEAAEAMGTSRTSANRYFRELKEAGWLVQSPMGPRPTTPDPQSEGNGEEETSEQEGGGSKPQSESKTYQADTSPYQSDTYQSDTVPSLSSSPPSFSLPPFLSDSHNPLPKSFPHDSSLSVDVVEKISTADSARSPAGWIGGLPPGHHALRAVIPKDHPARSERHLQYHMAAQWSLRLLQDAEDAIKSFRIPSMLRRKIDRDEQAVVEDWRDTFRLLQEQDDYEWDEVRYAIHWLFTQSDWLREGFIASIGTLRKKTRSGDRTKFDVILTQAEADSSYDGPDSRRPVGGSDRDESPEERFARKRRAARRAVASG